MKVEITARAAADLEEIADWISEDNPERADSFVAELIEKGMSLSHNAQRFPKVGRWRVGIVRKLSWRGYVVLYCIRTERVDVVRIVQASNWAKLLSDG